MRAALIVLLFGTLAQAAQLDVRGKSRFVVDTKIAGQVIRGDHGIVGYTRHPLARLDGFDWASLNGKWVLEEVTEGVEKFRVTLDFAYLKNCGAIGGVREHNGAYSPFSGWTFMGEKSANIYSFFLLGEKFTRLELNFKPTGELAATTFTIISDNKEEYPIPVTFVRAGAGEVKAYDTNVLMSAPPLIYEDDSYYVEMPIVPGGAGSHPALKNALTCFVAPGMGIFNPNVPDMIVTLSKGQKKGAYLLAMAGSTLIEREVEKTVISAGSSDRSFWQRFYR